ncbi:MAG: class I SAM-dependent methyltransferase, partial [Pirellula sp.]
MTSAKQIAPGHLPFKANSLDGLILADVIEHLPNAWTMVGKCSEAVRPGGWVVISVPNMRSIYVLHQFFIRGDWPEED